MSQEQDYSALQEELAESRRQLLEAQQALDAIRSGETRKQGEPRLAEREELFNLFIENAPAAIAMFDGEMRYPAVSRRFIDDYRLGNELNLIGRSHYDMFPEMPQRWRDIHKRVLSGEDLSGDEEAFPRADGRTDWVRWSMKPWRKADGRIGGAVLFTEVITKQVQARLALARSEARLRRLEDSNIIGIVTADMDHILEANRVFLDMIGYTQEELRALGIGWRAITPPEHAGADERGLEQLLSTGTCDPFQKEYIRKDGSRVPILIGAAELQRDPWRCVCFILDLTEQKKAERALRESEERFRGIFAHASTGIAIMDLKGRYQACNPAYTTTLGYTEAELRGLNYENLIHPDDRASNTGLQERLIAGEIPSFEVVTRYFSKQGDVLWVHRHVSLLRDAANSPA
ncbi:MAG: PAS domain S-box protein, partial [Rhodomicrobium sp.]